MASGCAAHLNIQGNMFANQYTDPRFSGKFLLKTKAIQARAQELIKEYLVKCKSQKQEVGMLSGHCGAGGFNRTGCHHSESADAWY